MHSVGVTHTVSPAILLLAETYKISLLEIPLIQKQELAPTWSFSASAQAWIFTSRTAVQAVLHHPEWKQHLPDTVYLVGKTTASAWIESLPAKQVIGDNGAEELAARVKHTDVQFFCGNRSLAVLPEILRKNNIRLEQTIVYETRETVPDFFVPPVVCMVCMSPSAAQVLAAWANPALLDVWAWGTTTAKACRELNFRSVKTASKPDWQTLLTELQLQLNLKNA